MMRAMTNDESASERLVAQRVRNRIMEEVWSLSKGDAGVRRAWSPTEWFETFFDLFPYEGEPTWYPAMTSGEADAVRTVCKLMQLAVADPAVPKNPTIEQIIESGWPSRIAPFAQKALDLMLSRGRFSEEIEEEEPSTHVPWP